ncbi:MAG: beta-lactamase family protein [Halieaceae bacterium]|jgi:CubicO group peptidase (beta-lactamase class C family)|nr:beta-lactamase family protein [Halieaceae bacterium]MBT5557016.1 beta-lactamase family protein [Halieaceae bacterium]MBT6181700.1 beta-lactamase family protein [Halieaceae bacterium]MDG1799208.1 serine hydrolase [Luminiphilus sp.]
MKALYTFLVLTIFTVSAQAATQKEVAAFIERLKAGDLDTNVLLYPTSDRRIAFAHVNAWLPTRPLFAAQTPYPLNTKIDQSLADVSYQVAGETFSVRDFLAREPLMGIAVVEGDTIRLEHYAEDHNPESVWISFSVTKSFTSTLIGAAIKDGFINSIEDRVATYLPRLKGSAYGAVSIKNILQMSSGVAWNENYTDPNSDVSKAGSLQGVALTDYLGALPQNHAPGTVFNYNTAESNLLGEVLRAAIGNSATDYMNAKVWQGFGMEHAGNWMQSAPFAGETGGCCISASIRDYARLGIFVKKGAVNATGESLVPDGWMKEATSPSKGYAGYGYKWWLEGDGAYAASGIFGQGIYIDPQRDVVISLHSNAPAAVDTNYHAHADAVIKAIAASFDR